MIRVTVSFHRRKNTRQKRPTLKLGAWNIRTMVTGFNVDLKDANDVRKTAIINNE